LTPGYWCFADGLYVWNPGYWAPAVGFYGGINYGYGYFGQGYQGGYWRDQKFYYNRAVNDVGNTNVTTVYNTKVTNVTVNHVSYNGGPGGVDARPSSQEQAAGHQGRHAPTSEQNAHAAGARGQHDLLASVNQGRPAIAATSKPNTFSGSGTVAARAAGGHGAAAHAAPPANGAAHSEEPPRRLAQAAPQTAPPAKGAGEPAPSRAEPQHQRQEPAHQEPPRPAQSHQQRPEDHSPQ